MRHRVLHGDGSTTSELVLGTWGLSGTGYGPVPEGTLDAAIDRAVALGVTLVDGAEHYAGGGLFRALSGALARHPQLGLMARIGVRDDGAGRRVRSLEPSRVSESLRRIVEESGRPRIDLCMLHTPSVAELAPGGAVEAIRDGVRAGLVRTWGASVSGVSEAHAAIDAGALALALPFNAFFQPIYRAIAARARGRGVRLFAHSVLAYGLLAGRWAPGHTFEEGDHRAERWAPHELAARLEHLEVLRRLVRGEVHGLRSAALRYVLNQDGITAAIVGPRSVAQLDELARDIAHIEGAALPIEDVVAFEALARARGLLD
jgi:aryl-alcohol dehydrogenase-like predicted oxidoreductase